jgi:hypothetical protein
VILGTFGSFPLFKGIVFPELIFDIPSMKSPKKGARIG